MKNVSLRLRTQDMTAYDRLEHEKVVDRIMRYGGIDDCERAEILHLYMTYKIMKQCKADARRIMRNDDYLAGNDYLDILVDELHTAIDTYKRVLQSSSLIHKASTVAGVRMVMPSSRTTTLFDVF